MGGTRGGWGRGEGGARKTSSPALLSAQGQVGGLWWGPRRMSSGRPLATCGTGRPGSLLSDQHPHLRLTKCFSYERSPGAPVALVPPDRICGPALETREAPCGTRCRAGGEGHTISVLPPPPLCIPRRNPRSDLLSPSRSPLQRSFPWECGPALHGGGGGAVKS